MKKLLISIFLMLSMVVSGLSSLQFTPVASAINKSAVRCDFLGQFINPNSDGKKCEPCPVDFYCPLVSGTEIENCTSKGYPDVDCKESRKIFSTDRAIACPSGTTTKGFTFNTLAGTRITENGDAIFPLVGQGATDKSMCQAPDFKCPADKPVLLRTFDANGVAQEAKCFPINTCNQDQIAILKNGIPDCSVACKDTIVNGKCFQDCPEGEYLEVTSENKNGVKTQSVICKKIVVIVKVCPIIGQAPTVIGDLSTCICTTPQVVSADKTKCELPLIPCKAPQTGYEPNCISPIAPCPANSYGANANILCTPCPNGGTNYTGSNATIETCYTACPINTYGYYYQSNGKYTCIPCPNGSTTPTAGTKDSSGCVIKPSPCPANYYGTNGNVLCTPCPNGGTSNEGTQYESGCKAKENGGGGFCGGFWAIVCGAVVATTIDCFLTKVLCNKSQPETKNTSEVYGPTYQPYTENKNTSDRYVYISKSQSSYSSCSQSNQELVSKVMSYRGSHIDGEGKNFFWVSTQTTQISGITKTASLSTTRSMYEEEIPELKCLMNRFAKLTNTTLGTKEYMESLCGFRINGKCDNVLHGRNINPNSEGFNKECLDLDALLSVLSNYSEGENSATSTQWAAAKSGTQIAISPWFGTKYEVVLWANQNKAIVSDYTKSNISRKSIQKRLRTKTSTIPFNIFSSINASALTLRDENEGTGEVASNDSPEAASNQESISEEGDLEEFNTLALNASSGVEQYPCNGSNIEFNINDDIQTKIDGLSALGCNYYDYEDSNDASGESGVSVTDANYSQYLNSDCDQYAPYDYKGSCYDLVSLKQLLAGGNSSSDACSGNGEYSYTVAMDNGYSFCGTYQESTSTDAQKMAIYKSFSNTIDNAMGTTGQLIDTSYIKSGFVYDVQTCSGYNGVQPYYNSSKNLCYTKEQMDADTDTSTQNTTLVETEESCNAKNKTLGYWGCQDYTAEDSSQTSNKTNLYPNLLNCKSNERRNTFTDVCEEVFDNGKTQSEIDQAEQNCRTQGKEYNMYLDRCGSSTTQDAPQKDSNDDQNT